MSNKKSSTAIDDEKKKATNLYNALVNDSKSVFYATNEITNRLVRKARNSLYKKDIVFVNIYNRLENKKFLLEKWGYKHIKNLSKETEESNTKFNVKMYITHLRGGQAFAAEQKTRELKNNLLRSKRIEKLKGKRIKPNELIKKQRLI